MALKRVILFFAALLCVFGARAEGEIDVKHVVLGHIGDSYEWHIATVGHAHITLPLPVIVRGSDGVWHAFLSDKLPCEGFQIAAEGDYAGKVVETAGGERPLDMSFTKTALALVINCAILLLVILPVARWYRRGRMDAPGGLRGAVDSLVGYVYDEVIVPGVGEGEARRYAPLLLTMFFFILVNNLMGLIPIFPGGGNVTGNIAVTMLLALTTLIVVNCSGTKEYWKEVFWPEVPVWLKVPAPIMPAIEFVGVFSKPFALMIRLFANMFAGHAVIMALVCVIFITVRLGAAINGTMMGVSVIFSIFMFCMELLVAFIQAYVFTLLSSVFIGMARVRHEHH